MSEIPHKFKGIESQWGPAKSCIDDIFMGVFKGYELWYRPADFGWSGYNYDVALGEKSIYRLRKQEATDDTITWSRSVHEVTAARISRYPPLTQPIFEELDRRVVTLCPQHLRQLKLLAKFRRDHIVAA